MRRFLVPKAVLEESRAGSNAPRPKQGTQRRIEDLAKVVVLPKGHMSADTTELLRLKNLLRRHQQRHAERTNSGDPSSQTPLPQDSEQRMTKALRQLSCYVLSTE